MKAVDSVVCVPVIRRDVLSLSDLGEGQRGRVVRVEGDVDLRRRLLEMGFCNGTVIEMVRAAPLGDPVEYRVRGYCVSLRRDQARHVIVAPA